MQGTTEFGWALEQYYSTGHCKLRTEYQRAITAAYEVFGAENVYIGVYENMFEPAEIERLSAFCGVAVRAHLSEVVVNKTRGKVLKLPELEQKVRQAYQHVYDYCYAHIPVTQSLWS